MANGSGLGGRVGRLLLANRRLRIGLAAVLVVALLAGGLLQLLPLQERKATIQAAETTNGTIVSAEYGRNTYDITYNYSVDGQTYESTRVFPGPYAPGGTAGQSAREALPIHQAGDTATVHYQPDDPDYAYLTTREGVVSRHVVYYLAAGAGALLLVAYLYVERTLGGDSEESASQHPTAGNAGQAMGGQTGNATMAAQAGLVARAFGLLKRVGLVLAVGGLLLLASGYALSVFLSP